jgi:hypothetical protein
VVRFEGKKEAWRTAEEGKGRRDIEEIINGNQYTGK